MALVSKKGFITTNNFAAFPSMSTLNLETLEINDGSTPKASAASRFALAGTQDILPIVEGCFITKTVKYTHELVNWINAEQSPDNSTRDEIVRLFHFLYVCKPS